MRGPEHYTTAETLGRKAASLLAEAARSQDPEAQASLTALAAATGQLAGVHATLAQAAATAAAYALPTGDNTMAEWTQLLAAPRRVT